MSQSLQTLVNIQFAANRMRFMRDSSASALSRSPYLPPSLPHHWVGRILRLLYPTVWDSLIDASAS